MGGHWNAFDALVRAMRMPTRHADSVALIDTASTALERCRGEDALRGQALLGRVTNLEELAHAHLRSLTADYLQGDERFGSEHAGWRAGCRFLQELLSTYRESLETLAPEQLQRGLRLELMVRRMRVCGNVLKWRALVYYNTPDAALWQDVVATYQLACAEGLAARHVVLRQGRAAQTSVERELLRTFALGCAGLDQLPPDAIDLSDRMIRYAAAALRLSRSADEGARFVLPLAPAAAPYRLRDTEGGPAPGIYLWPGEAAAVLEELAGVVAKGLVPAVLATGPRAGERVLGVVHHLLRQWGDIRRTRRQRRHPLQGKLKALMGFRHLHAGLLEGGEVGSHADGWGMLDVSRNGIGILVPAADCDRIVVGDLLGVQAEGGTGWHVGIVRRIVRSLDGAGIVGIETIAHSATAVAVDNGQALSDALICDPVRRGSAIRVVRPSHGPDASDHVFLSKDGRVCKLRRLSTLVRGSGYELSNYHVL